MVLPLTQAIDRGPSLRRVNGLGVLLLHGWQGSSDDHWQTLVAADLGGDPGIEVRFPALPDPDTPDPSAWAAALHEQLAVLAALAEPAARVVCCQSLGSVLWLREAGRIAPEHRVGRVVLVAPPSARGGIPEIEAFFGFTPDPEAVAGAATATRLVCSDNDPYAAGGDPREEWAAPARLAVDLLPGAGHVNPDSGFGPWPEMVAWVRCERARLTPPDATARDIPIRDGMVRLGQLLKLAGVVDSGAEIKVLLAKQTVLVNGAAESRRGRQLHVGDEVELGGQVLRVSTRT